MASADIKFESVIVVKIGIDWDDLRHVESVDCVHVRDGVFARGGQHIEFGWTRRTRILTNTTSFCGNMGKKIQRGSRLGRSHNRANVPCEHEQLLVDDCKVNKMKTYATIGPAPTKARGIRFRLALASVPATPTPL